MRQLRDTICANRRLTAVLLVLALAMKLLVPAGYMPGQGAKVLTVQVCAESIGKHLTTQIVLPQSGAPSDHDHGVHGKGGDGTCTFSALSMASLAGADAALLVLALAFILALGFAAQAPPVRQQPAYLRPPLRGPPVFA